MATSSQLDAFFTSVLQQVGAPPTKPNLDFLKAWSQVENTAAKNNPLATTQTAPGSVALPNNSSGVQQYPSAAIGATATAQTLQGYPNILAGLRTGNILALSFRNPPGLVHDFIVWSGNAKNPSRGQAYYVKIVRAAQGNPTGAGATDIGSYDLGNAAHDAGNAARDAGNATGLTSLYDLLKKITDPAYILRGLEILGGGLLVLLGLYLLARQVGLGGFDVPDPLNPATRRAEEAAAAVSEEKAVRSRERHASAQAVAAARVKTEQARATELRTRVKHRRRQKSEQDKEVERAYIRGVAESNPL